MQEVIAKTSIALLLGMTALALAGDPKSGAPDASKTQMEMPKAPQEVADRVKAMSGTWKCTGTAAGMDGKDMKFVGSMKSKADLDGFWVHDSFDGTMGDGKAAMHYKFEAFATFDPASKKWRNTMVDNMGGQMAGTADPMKDGRMDTTGEVMDTSGKSQFKDHVDVSDMKKGAHMWGESSRDNGKTWNKVYDMLCKK